MTRTDSADAALGWWRALQPMRDGASNRTSDRAALARLRRADLIAAMDDDATFDLFRALGRTRPNDLVATALCAAVLAGVRAEAPEHPARSLGPPPGEGVERAPMKPIRFRRLIEAESPEDRLTALRRAVQLADRKLNVRELARACLHWSDDTRRRWIFEYHNAGFATPADTVAEETAA